MPTAPSWDITKRQINLKRRQRQQDGSYLTVDNFYLQVVDRVEWLNEIDPGATIEVVPVSSDDPQRITIKCTVTLTTGGKASAFGSAEIGGKFPAYERADTAALGRALGRLGFGTALDDEDAHEGPDGPEGVVDAPRQPPARNLAPIATTSAAGSSSIPFRAGAAQQAQRPTTAATAGQPRYPASDKQKGMIRGKCVRDFGMSEDEMNQFIFSKSQSTLDTIGGKDASAVIEALLKDDIEEWLQNHRNAAAPAFAADPDEPPIGDGDRVDGETIDTILSMGEPVGMTLAQLNAFCTKNFGHNSSEITWAEADRLQEAVLRKVREAKAAAEVQPV